MRDRVAHQEKIVRRAYQTRRFPWDMAYAIVLFLAVMVILLFARPVEGLSGFSLEGIIGAGYLPSTSMAIATESATIALPVTGPEALPATPTGASSEDTASPSGDSQAASSSAPAPEQVLVAIVLDDNGYNLEQAEPLIHSPYPFTLAIMPSLGYTSAIGLEAKANHKEVILHCPMEAYQGNGWLGSGALFTSMSAEEIRRQLAADLAELPDAAGVNNHMGTKFTEDREGMRVVLTMLKERGLFYLDSRVTPDSVAEDVGSEVGIKVLSNRIFLDNDKDAGSIRARLADLHILARKRGYAIGIGHVTTDGILPLLEEAVAAWQNEGIRLVRLSDLLPYVPTP